MSGVVDDFGSQHSAALTAPQTSFDVAQPFLESAPVDLVSMAQELGIRVNMDANLPDNVSGRIMRVPGSKETYAIDVNRTHSGRRRRFTLAHEIAHFLLHRNRIGDGITDDALYRSSLGDYIETEANRMAAQLIMPSKLVRTLYRAGVRSLSALCNQFDVSEDAMRIRLTQLRLGV